MLARFVMDKAVRARLTELGFLSITGFQKAQGLVVDGIVGPKTRMALWPDAVAQKAPTEEALPLWLRYAIAEIGQKEVVGRGSNARILAYRQFAKTTDDMQTEDGSRPWCADFVNAMLELADIHGTRSGMARSFEKSPHFVKLKGPALGAIVTQWRGTRSSGSGHVYFYAGQVGDDIVALGGNQRDSVCVVGYSDERVTGYWWPASLPLPATGYFPAVVKLTGKAGSEV